MFPQKSTDVIHHAKLHRTLYSVNLSPGFKNEFYPLQRGFRSFVNSAWISRGFRVDTNKC